MARRRPRLGTLVHATLVVLAGCGGTSEDPSVDASGTSASPSTAASADDTLGTTDAASTGIAFIGPRPDLGDGLTEDADASSGLLFVVSPDLGEGSPSNTYCSARAQRRRHEHVDHRHVDDRCVDLTDPAGDLQCTAAADEAIRRPWGDWLDEDPPVGLEHVGWCAFPP